jgi:hypothetical protein
VLEEVSSSFFVKLSVAARISVSIPLVGENDRCAMVSSVLLLSSSQIVTGDFFSLVNPVVVDGKLGNFMASLVFVLVVHFEIARGETGVNAAVVVTVLGGSSDTVGVTFLSSDIVGCVSMRFVSISVFGVRNYVCLSNEKNEQMLLLREHLRA